MPLSRSLIVFVLLAAAFIHFTGIFVTLQGPDATIYASISKTMVLKNDFIDLYLNGNDWLDKPHFPFWITAIFFKLFGIHTWTYKLPGILFTMMGAYYTWLLAKKLYNKETALLATLIFLTAQHIVLSDFDVRAEPFLTGLIIAATYHFYQNITTYKFIHLLFACIFTACAIMTKGLFAIIPIGSAIVGQLIISKSWKQLFHIKWLLSLVLIAIFILPELYCLYQQFDLHPTKLVFNSHHVSGIKFFFWDSQFGRFFNTGPIKGEGDLFFFFHTLLWAFLPWSILLYAAFIYKFKSKGKDNKEWICLLGSLTTFLVFSLSKFQLPYYLNIVFPFFSIILASYLIKIKTVKTIRLIKFTQMFLIILLLIALIIIHILFHPGSNVLFYTFLLIGIISFGLIGKNAYPLKYKIVASSLIISLIINSYLNIIFYPILLKYQSGSEAAFWINKHTNTNIKVVSIGLSYPLNFYLNRPLTIQDSISQNLPSNTILYLPSDQLKFVNNNFDTLQSFVHFKITQLTLPFINYSTRNKELSNYSLIRIK